MLCVDGTRQERSAQRRAEDRKPFPHAEVSSWQPHSLFRRAGPKTISQSEELAPEGQEGKSTP